MEFSIPEICMCSVRTGAHESILIYRARDVRWLTQGQTSSWP